MTAVWLEVGMLQVKQSHGTEAPASSSQNRELSVNVVSSGQAELVLKQGGRVIQKAVAKGESAELMVRQLEQTVAGWTAGSSAISSAMIETRPGVSYGDLVRVMDGLRRNQVVNLGVVPASREAAAGSVR
ncbi:MAG: hypothetical protein ACK5QT_06765 [Oligoflexia bacterium]